MSQETETTHIASVGIPSSKLRGSFAAAGLSLAIIALAYPGRATNDTLGWLLQVRRHDIVDVQPPGAPLLLSIFDSVWPGPFSLVAINLVLLCFGLMIFWGQWLRSVATAIAASLTVLSYPAVLTILPVAWRDITGLALTILTLALALRLWNIERGAYDGGNRGLIWAGILALGVAGAFFRANHAAGVLPLVALPLYPIMQRYLGRSGLLPLLGSMLGALLILVAASMIAFALSSAITRPVYSMQAWNLYRLTQMSVELQKNLLPPALYPKVGVPELEALMDASDSPYRSIFWTAYSRANNDLLPVINTPEQYRVLSKAFSDAVIEHPATFATISLREMWSYFDWWRAPTGSYYVKNQPSGVFKVTSPDGTELALDINWPTAVPEASEKFLRTWSKLVQPALVRNPLPIMTLSIVLGLLAFALRLPAAPLMMVTALAAVTHFLGIIWIASLFDFRFGHQSIALSVIAILLFAIDASVAVLRCGTQLAKS